MPPSRAGPRPWGMKWRSSAWFTTLVVSLGILTDTLLYSLPVPVLPFQLQKLGYHDVASLAGWLLFAYSGGLVIATLPVSMFSEKYNMRRAPLVLGLGVLLASQILFMLAPNYIVMVIARVIQGVSSALVWVVGLALLCDAVPEKDVGKQLGIAMVGIPVGLLLGAPLGGILYGKFGFHGPFIFGIIITFIDLVGRFLVLEQKDVAPFLQADATALVPLAVGGPAPAFSVKFDASATPTSPLKKRRMSIAEPDAEAPRAGHARTYDSVASIAAFAPEPPREPLPFMRVLVMLLTSPRALAAIANTLIVQMAFTATDPTLPLYLQDVFHLNAAKVGLVSLSAVVPAFISSPLAGYLCDNFGPQWVIIGSTLLGMPFWLLATIEHGLVLFIGSYVLLSFFITAFISGLVAELAVYSQESDGRIGYAHVYGVFQLATGIGNAIGPILGGQVYDSVTQGHGWRVICYIAVGLFALSTIFAVGWSGADPLLSSCLRRRRARPAKAVA